MFPQIPGDFGPGKALGLLILIIPEIHVSWSPGSDKHTS